MPSGGDVKSKSPTAQKDVAGSPTKSPSKGRAEKASTLFADSPAADGTFPPDVGNPATVGATNSSTAPYRGLSSAVGKDTTNWPEVLVRWEAPSPPMVGTPAQPAPAELGNIRSLRLTETDKRKQKIVNKRTKAASAAKGPKAPKPEVEATAATSQPRTRPMIRQLPPLPAGSSRPLAVPPSGGISMLLQAQQESQPANTKSTPAAVGLGVDLSGSTSETSEPPDEESVEPCNLVIMHIAHPNDGATSAGKAPGFAEAECSASRLHALVKKTTEESWICVVKEFDVQCQVWESAALLRAAKSKEEIVDPSKRPEATMKEELRAILAHASPDGEVVRALDAILQSDVQAQRPILSRSFGQAVQSAIRSQDIGRLRLQLAVTMEAWQPMRRASIGPQPIAPSVTAAGPNGGAVGDRGASEDAPASDAKNVITSTGGGADVGGDTTRGDVVVGAAPGAVDANGSGGANATTLDKDDIAVKSHKPDESAAVMPSDNALVNSGIEQKHENFEKLIRDCELNDFRLEYCARRVLGLPMDAGNMHLKEGCCDTLVDNVVEGFFERLLAVRQHRSMGLIDTACMRTLSRVGTVVRVNGAWLRKRGCHYT